MWSAHLRPALLAREANLENLALVVKLETVKKGLHLIALVLAVGAVGFWLAAGANRGWTKNKRPVKVLDEVTGIEGVTYEKCFVPGVEYLAAALLGAGILAGVSFLFRTRNQPQLKSGSNEAH
jgi:hypothetical protein